MRATAVKFTCEHRHDFDHVGNKFLLESCVLFLVQDNNFGPEEVTETKD